MPSHVYHEVDLAELTHGWGHSERWSLIAKEGYCQGCGELGPLPVSGRFCDGECWRTAREARAVAAQARASGEEEKP
jgi:hypothetical protein